MSFILPEIGPVTDVEKGALSAAVFVGMLVGGLVAGSASDVWGRKPLLVGCLAVNALFGLLSAFSPGWQVLATLRVLAGVGVGGSIPGVFTLFVEYLPVRRRGFYISIVAFHWMLGTIYAAGAAWVIIGVLGASWRIFAAVCAIPAGAAALLTLFVLPESPRYSFVKGDWAACSATLRLMARWNRVPPPAALLQLPAEAAGEPGVGDDGPAVPISPRRGGGPAAVAGGGKGRSRRRCCSLTEFRAGAAEAWRQMREQARDFVSPSLRRTSLLLLAAWFALSFGWYGLVLWIPTLFKQADVEMSVYQDSFLVAAANLPGNIVATALMDVVGRKALMNYSLVGACLCTVFFAVAKSEALVVTAACLLNAVSVGCWNALDCLSTESFPTRLRTSSMGFLAASGRVGSIVGQFVFGAMVSVSVPALLGTAAGVLALGAVAGFLLPAEPSGKHLADFAAGGSGSGSHGARGGGATAEVVDREAEGDGVGLVRVGAAVTAQLGDIGIGGGGAVEGASPASGSEEEDRRGAGV